MDDFHAFESTQLSDGCVGCGSSTLILILVVIGIIWGIGKLFS